MFRFFHKTLRLPYALNVHFFTNPRRAKKTIILLHGIGASWPTWQPVADYLPKNYRVIAVDLLGFGDSPKPDWEEYDVKVQARSIALTLLKNGVFGPVVIVGHSMGSLIAIELAKHSYPVITKTLILCSPPIYRPRHGLKLHHPERILRKIYRFIHSHPKNSKSLLKLATRYHLWPDRGFKADDASANSFLKALDAAIISQTTIHDIEQLSLPMIIISGKLDPLIVEGNLKSLAKKRPNITHISMASQGHEVTKTYAKRIAKVVTGDKIG